MLAALIALLTSMAALGAGGGSSSSVTSTGGTPGTGFASKDDDDDEIDDFLNDDDDKGDTAGGGTGGGTGAGGGDTGSDGNNGNTGSGGGSTGGDTGSGGGTTGGGDTGGNTGSGGGTDTGSGGNTGSGGGSTGGGTGSGGGTTGGGSTGGGNTGGGTTPDAPANPNPTTGGQDGSSDGGDGGSTSTSSGSYSVDGGRVTTLSVENQDDVASIRVLDGPSHGNLTVNPDNTMALVMSMDNSFSGNMSVRYEVTYNDGTTNVVSDNINVTPTTQGAGWGQGNFYMLETNAEGDVIVETGDNHRDVFISGSNNALSIQDIAAREGILNTNQITGSWLRDHPEYGGSEGMALNEEAGMRLWAEITGGDTEPSSHWLQFESGYEYNNIGRLVEAGTTGESPLHPVHITSYGDGPQPVLNGTIYLIQQDHENIVISDVAVVGSVQSLQASNLIFDNVNVTGGGVDGVGLFVAGGDGITVNNSSVVDVVYAENPNGSAYWSGGDGTAGLLAGNNTGLLIQGSYFDHNGWSDDYSSDLSANGGQPPSMFSHNVYVDYDNEDVTFRDNITMRAAMFGAHLRGGAFAEDNLFLDNNAAVDFFGGDFYGAGAIGNYTLFTDNVITSAGHRTTDSVDTNGALAMGVDNNGNGSTLLDNIIAHLADPNNAQEVADKIGTNTPVQNSDTPYYDDSIVYNWQGSGPWAPDPGAADRNIGALSESVLDATTIQAFTQQLLGDPNANISDLADFLRAQANGQLDDYVDADLIIDFFQTGFGLTVDARLTSETLRFVPDELGDGIRWDNRLNWDTDDLPGTVSGDSVDLGGNWVNFGGLTSTIEDLDFGEGGLLNITSGRLNVNDHTATGEAGGELNISGAGQLWMDGYTDQDMLDIDVDGGRFVNTGLFTGTTDLDITDGQAVLASSGADFVLNANSSIEITGDDARVGFDGTGGDTSVLLLAEGSDLIYTAENGEGLSTIEEFRSGAHENSDVQSGVNLGNARLELNLAGLANGEHSLIEVDELIGEFGDIDVTGLGSRGATVTIDYEADRVLLSLSDSGGGLQINTVGNADDAQANSDLWAALTNGHGIYAGDNPNDIPSEDDDLDEAA